MANSSNELAVLPTPHTALATTYALCPLPPAPLVGHEEVVEDIDRFVGEIWDATAEPDDVDELYRRHAELFGPPDGDAAVATSVERLRATLREYVEFWTS